MELVRRAVEGLPTVRHPNWEKPGISGKLGAFTPTYVILHHTAGTNSLSWLASGGDHPPVPGANFLIARDGTIHLLSGSMTYHAGKGRLPGSGVPDNMMNAHSFGIEIESLGKVQDLTDAQITAASRLTRNLLDGMGVDVTHAMNHKTWSSTGKTDTLYSDSWWRARIAMDDVYRGGATMVAKDDFLSLKDLTPVKFRTNRDVKITIDGKSKFLPEAGGRGTVAEYGNVKLPPAGSPERAALERGMVRTWFQQLPPGKSTPDITGLDNQRRVGLWGNRRLTFSAVWPHSKHTDAPWQFCFLVEAFDASGKPVDLELTLYTREIKILGEKP
jgi:hypothetical protein